MTRSRPKAPPRKKRSKRRSGRRRLLAVAVRLGVVAIVLALAVFLAIWVEVTGTFEGRLWSDPSIVYSAPWTVRPGDTVDALGIERRLARCGYATVDVRPSRPGTYSRRPGRIDAFLRETETPGGTVPPRLCSIRIERDVVTEIRGGDGRLLPEIVFEPEVLATLYGPRQEERRPLTIDEFPEGFVRAVLAAEDARYWEHAGVDARAIVRAALANVRSGRVVQGGSTIPQQTVKNLYLGHERTFWRKLREIPMAFVLDLRYSKRRILEVYLNEVYLGQRGPVAVCGAESAARHYFGRSLVDLSVGEWALLAGMIRSPGRYNPFAHPDAALARRNQVLDAQVRLGWIEEDERDRASREPLRLGSGESGFTRARYLADAVRADLRRVYSPEILEREGLRVHTSVDTRIQEAAEDALADGLARLERERPSLRRAGKSALQGAIVVTEPGTGAVLALVGGRDYASTQFNRAIAARRQPGSCFKPFVYLAAFEGDGDEVVTPATRIRDEPLELQADGDTWRPSNYDRRFRGIVTAREALRDSLNVPTVRLAGHVGLRRVIETARACGIESDLRPFPSLALGAQEVTPMELAAAYGTLANGGLRAPPRILVEIRDRDGHEVERRDADLDRVADRRAVFLVNSVLQDVFDRGTARSARAAGWRARSAGKTGTTDDTRDAWFVGYNPRVLALVWVGFDDNGRTGLTGATGALPIWTSLMHRVPETLREAEFHRAPGVESVRIDPRTGGRAVPACPEAYDEWFVAGTAPEVPCPEHAGRVRRWFRDLFRRRQDVGGEPL